MGIFRTLIRTFIRMVRKEKKEVIRVKTEVEKERIVEFVSALDGLEERVKKEGEMFFRFKWGETDIATKLELKDLIAEGNIEEIEEEDFPIRR